MDAFGSGDDTKANIQADMPYRGISSNPTYIRRLERRIEKLEEYLSLEWSESNDKYYKISPTTNTERKE